MITSIENMCSANQRRFLQALPKCEHHMHLEGALTPELLFTLAAKNSIVLPKDDPAFESPEKLRERYTRFISLDDFLRYYYIGMSALVNTDDFEALAWDYFGHASADGVVHAEVFFDPQAHLARGVPYDNVVAGFQRAKARAQTLLGISSELICCFLRHLPVSDCLATFEDDLVQQSIQRGNVCAIGLDSSETNFPPQLFTELYERARALGIRRTAHAGEEASASYIADAIDLLHVQRIDHGIALVGDQQLLQRVADNQILLTICPISNVLLRNASSVADLPIRRFLDAGVQFSINSDDPAYFGNTYVLDNYCAVQDAFQLSHDEWRRICEASIRGSWCSDERKLELLCQLNGVMDEW